MENLKILGIAGSLRRDSYNRALLRAAGGLVPPDVRLETFDLNGIPTFNADLEAAMPAAVSDFKARIRAADAILFVTPEYNYSVPGVLKNAIDWASRPTADSAWEGKPAAMMSASTSMLGGARAQYHLRQTMVFLNMYPVNRPEVMVTFAAQKFDENGNLIDAKAKELIGNLLKTLADWTRRIKG